MCCAIAKYLLFIFNLVFWMAGCAMLGVGIWLNVDSTVQNSVEVLGTNIVITGAIVLIAAGAIMLLFGFVGCCGAIKESTCLLGTYAGLLFIVLGIEVGLGIWAFVTYDSVDALVHDTLISFGSLDSTTDNENPITATEQTLHCCGYTKGCADWSGVALGCGCHTESDPYCSKNPLLNGCTVEIQYDGFYSQTCEVALVAFIENNMYILAWVALVIGLIEIFGIVFSVGLCCNVKKDNKRY